MICLFFGCKWKGKSCPVFMLQCPNLLSHELAIIRIDYDRKTGAADPISYDGFLESIVLY
jgi:hypothetical protein